VARQPARRDGVGRRIDLPEMRKPPRPGRLFAKFERRRSERDNSDSSRLATRTQGVTTMFDNSMNTGPTVIPLYGLESRALAFVLEDLEYTGDLNTKDDWIAGYKWAVAKKPGSEWLDHNFWRPYPGGPHRLIGDDYDYLDDDNARAAVTELERARLKREDPAHHDHTSPEYRARAAAAEAWHAKQERERQERYRRQEAARKAENVQREREAAEAGEAHYDYRNDIGLTEKKLVSGEARRAGLLARAREAAAVAAQVARERASPATSSFPEPIAAGDLMKRELNPVLDLIPGVLERGLVNCIDGPGGSHKSRLALQMLLTVAAGGMWFGQHQLEKCSTVFLSSEDDANEIHRRIDMIAKELKLPVADALVWDLTGVNAALCTVTEGGDLAELPFLGVLVKRLKAIHGHKFVVLDSAFDYIRYLRNAKIDEGAVNAVYKGLLTRICTHCDCTILVIRHPSRTGISEGTMEGWSVANTNSVRSRLSLAPHKKTRDAYVLTVEKRNHGPAGKDWTLYYTNGSLLPRDAMDTAQQQAVANAAIVQVAIDEAVAGRPINHKAGFTPGQLTKFVEASGGFPMTKGEVLDILRDCSGLGKPLMKIESGGRHVAGFFPAENGDEISRRLKSNK
jgi:hypothetical protein